MSYTKGQLVAAAFTEAGFGDYVFDLLPEQIMEAVRSLDRMMAAWNDVGIRLSYPVPSGPGGTDPLQESNIPDMAWDAVIANLAVRIAPGYGKTVSPDTRAAAIRGYKRMAARAARNPVARMPEMPAGAGNKSVEDPVVPGDPPGRVGKPKPSVSFE